MNKSELIERLLSSDEEEVLIDIDGWQYDIEIGHVEEAFDGFDEVFPAAISLKAKKS